MDANDLFKLYLKERQYQEEAFGPYENNPALNLSSFLAFIEETLRKAKKGYVGAWSKDLPLWLKECAESSSQGTAPAATYGYLIKVFVLAGAALESYSEIDIENWRSQGIKDKWKE